MQETLEKIMKEKISADHLLYVSMRYTKTCDVMINLLKRWKIMMDYSFEGLLEKARRKKMVKAVPTAPKLKLDTIKEAFKKNPEVMEAVKLYDVFRLIDVLQKTKEDEFRKGVCLRVIYQGTEIPINLVKLKEYYEILERFINYTKLFLLDK